MSASWLPAARAATEAAMLDWWEPQDVADWLAPGVTWRSLRYIVVDELHEGVAGLVVSPWPRQDERGRLHFGDEEQTETVVTLAGALLELLREDRTAITAVDPGEKGHEELRARELAIGDVFAARVRRGRGGGGGGGAGGDGERLVVPREWIRGEILDITAAARELTKAQAAATTSGVMDADLLATILEEFEEGEGEPPTTPSSEGSPHGSSGDPGAAEAPEPVAEEKSAGDKRAGA